MYGFAPSSSLPIGAVPAFSLPVTASERVLVLSPRDSDAGTVAASSEISNLPAANLQDMQPAKKWRSNAATTVSLTFTLAAPLSANAFALVGHNLSDVAVIRVRGAVDAANLTTAPENDSGWQSAWPTGGKPVAPSWPSLTSLVRWTPAAACAYWQVDIADPSPAQTYIEAGRAMLGAAWQPSLNFDLEGTPLGFDPPDVQSKTPYGRLFTDRRTESAPRLFELAFYALTKREAFDGLAEIQRLRGLWGDVICCLDPGEVTDLHRFTLQGVFSDRGAYTLPPAFDGSGNMFGAGIRLRELI